MTEGHSEAKSKKKPPYRGVLYKIISKNRTMTPKEKAIEFINGFQRVETDISIDGGYSFEKIDQHTAERCALIAAKLIKQQAKEWGVVSVKAYWNQVIEEIENY